MLCCSLGLAIIWSSSDLYRCSFTRLEVIYGQCSPFYKIIIFFFLFLRNEMIYLNAVVCPFFSLLESSAFTDAQSKNTVKVSLESLSFRSPPPDERWFPRTSWCSSQSPAGELFASVCVCVCVFIQNDCCFNVNLLSVFWTLSRFLSFSFALPD